MALNYSTNLNIRSESVNGIGTSALNFAQADSRVVWYMRNVSTAGQIISIGLGQPAVLNKGITLGPGQHIADSDSEGYQCFKGSFSAISSAPNGALAIMIRGPPAFSNKGL